MGKCAQVFQAIFHGVDDPETLVYLSHHEKTNVCGDLGTLEIYPDRPVIAFAKSFFLYSLSPQTGEGVRVRGG
jgi:hypothetical protein